MAEYQTLGRIEGWGNDDDEKVPKLKTLDASFVKTSFNEEKGLIIACDGYVME